VADRDCCVVSDLGELVRAGKKFGTIYADPPWKYGNQRTRAATDNHYPTLTVEQIAALPVAELAGNDCHLHLWTTTAFLFECPKLFEAWGFTYRSVLVWAKPHMGLGNYWRVAHEFLMLATRGDAPFLDHSIPSWILADRGSHSTKPRAVRQLVERVGLGPRLELFGRSAIDGWTVFGNQIARTMFDLVG
jgi:N6-adenosine-specific RNA methylase IME4